MFFTTSDVLFFLKCARSCELMDSISPFKMLNRLTGHTDDVLGLTSINDKELLSCSADGSAILWDLSTDKPSTTIKISDEAEVDDSYALSFIF